MRLFVAIPIPEILLDDIQNIQSKLKGTEADVKWVERENLHFTLRFLGEILEDRLQDAQEAIRVSSASSFPFSAELGEIGAFPSISSPRVIWLGLDKGKEEINDLAVSLEQELVAREFPAEDKPFHAHLTLGRARSAKRLGGLKDLLRQRLSLRGRSFSVTEMMLYSSTLTPRGPIYHVLYSFTLGSSTKAR